MMNELIMVFIIRFACGRTVGAHLHQGTRLHALYSEKRRNRKRRRNMRSKQIKAGGHSEKLL